MLLVDEAAILSTALEGMLYGWSVLMFVLSMWIFLRNWKRKRPNPLTIGAACALFLLSTAEMIVNIVRLCEGFSGVGRRLPGGPTQYFTNVAAPTFVAKSWLYNLQTIVFDAVVIHRAYVAWQNVYVVLLPFALWVGLIASTIGSNLSFARATVTAGDIFAASTSNWVTSVYAMTLAANLTSTALLAFRIWEVTRVAAEYRSTPLRPILGAVIESGAIYSLTIIAALVSFVVKSNSVFIILDMISPIICIVFHMIILRIGLVAETDSLQVTRAPSSLSAGSLVFASASRHQVPRQTEDPYQLKSLTMEIGQILDYADDEPTSGYNAHHDSSTSKATISAAV